MLQNLAFFGLREAPFGITPDTSFYYNCDSTRAGLNTLLVALPKVTMADIPNWAKDCMTPDSATVFPVAPSDPYPEDLLNAYFENGAATAPYDYATTPDPCAAG